jgi:hypothetical protein
VFLFLVPRPLTIAPLGSMCPDAIAQGGGYFVTLFPSKESRDSADQVDQDGVWFGTMQVTQRIRVTASHKRMSRGSKPLTGMYGVVIKPGSTPDRWVVKLEGGRVVELPLARLCATG